MVFGESAGFSFIPGVLAERSDDKIILEFDREVDDGILDLLRLTGYTETMPAELPESLPDARFVLDRENGNRVILDVSLLDRSTPIPATLIYDNKTEPVLAHIMLSEEPSPDKLPGGEKSYSAVISDIHLNDYRSQQGGWAWFDKNRDYLINFLDRLIENKEKYRELVLLGDVVGEKFVERQAEMDAEKAESKDSVLGDLAAKKDEVAKAPKKETVEKAAKSKGGEAI